MYWIPKLHKNPYKFRYITAATNCCNTLLSKLVTECLKIIRTFYKNYCNVIYRNSRINKFWSINNTNNFIEKLTSTNNVKQITTFDFSTLYTSLPQNLLIDNSSKLLEKPFSKNKYLITNCFNTYWSNNKSCSKNYFCFDKDTLFKSIQFLINNSYITFGNKIFHQVIGIPMGSNFSPLLADLFLFNCEHDFISSLNINDTFMFRNITRYIDDLAVINFPNFNNYISKIYPQCLEVTTTSNLDNIHYLDLNITISKPINFTIFDKREEFNFPIINFPHFSSNIPLQIFKSVFVSQLYRLLRLNSNNILFQNRLKILIDKLIYRKYPINLLRHVFNKFLSLHNTYRFFDGSCFRHCKFTH